MAVRVQKQALAFTRKNDGSVAIMFGLMFMAFAMIAGMAIDYGRVTHMRTHLVNAVDAAALAAGGALLDGRYSDAEIEAMALEYFERNMQDGGDQFGVWATPSVTVNRQSREVIIDVAAEVPMSITKIAGFTKVDIPVTSATRFDQRDIELGMALDVTGSMSGSKIQSLKKAAKDLVDILLPDGGQANKVRIGLAPYATSVNAGSFADVVTNRNGSGHTCVHERSGANRFSDIDPTSPSTKLGRKNSMSCPSATIQPLSDNKAVLKSTIDGYSAGGWTAGHLGAAWAWYTISPEWSSVWPAASKPVAYGDSNTLKAVILMTDGEFNTEYKPGNGNSSNQARGICDAMKDKDVAVYAVAFQAPSAARSLLNECSSGKDYYFSADNEDELRDAFQAIAKKLNNLRLSS